MAGLRETLTVLLLIQVIVLVPLMWGEPTAEAHRVVLGILVCYVLQDFAVGFLGFKLKAFSRVPARIALYALQPVIAIAYGLLSNLAR
jgi:hypothetical protein